MVLPSPLVRARLVVRLLVKTALAALVLAERRLLTEQRRVRAVMGRQVLVTARPAIRVAAQLRIVVLAARAL